MELWEKVKKGLEGGATTVSEKASEWFKTGTEMVKEGAEIVSEKASELSKFTKLKWEQHTLQDEINQEFIELGGKVYENWSDKTGVKIEGELNEIIVKIKALENELELKEKEIEEISKSVYKKNIKDLQKSLDVSGGTVEQVIITKKSPVLGKKLRDIELPKETLIGMVVRDNDAIIPDGTTQLLENDKVTLLGKKQDVEATVAFLTKG